MHQRRNDHGRLVVALVSGALGGALCAPASAQLRIATWNITSYDGGHESEIGAAVYSAFDGRSLAPDVLATQEMGAGGAAALLAILNTAPGSPGDWVAAPIPGTAGDSALLYRATGVTLLGTTLVAPGGPAPLQPRDIVRWDVRIAGYDAQEATIAIYSTHMKSGSRAVDRARRLLEAQTIRNDAEKLPPPWTFLLAGDLNIQTAGEIAYLELTDVQPDDRGRLFDPINADGIWHEREEFRFLHTQDPIGAGGMDDRFDQILLSRDLLDGAGLDYIGNPARPYSQTTWNDPNHSYRVWGNDGSSFNESLRTEGNTMVGPVIAEALREVARPGGHLPVFLDLRVPARLQAPPEIDFGSIPLGAIAERVLLIGNGGDVDRWGDGIEVLRYQLDAPAPFAAPAGFFLDPAGGPLNSHTIALDTSSAGRFEADLTVTTNAPDDPRRLIRLLATIICRPDLDEDGELTFFDLLAFQDLFSAGDLRADFSDDGALDFFDFLAFQDAFAAGC